MAALRPKGKVMTNIAMAGRTKGKSKGRPTYDAVVTANVSGIHVHVSDINNIHDSV